VCSSDLTKARPHVFGDKYRRLFSGPQTPGADIRPLGFALTRGAAVAALGAKRWKHFTLSPRLRVGGNPP